MFLPRPIHGFGSCSLSRSYSLSLAVTAGTSSNCPPAKEAGKSTMPTASARNSSSQPPPSVAKPVKPEPNMPGNIGGCISSGCSRDVAAHKSLHNSSSYSRQDGASRVNHPVDFAVCSSVCLPALVTLHDSAAHTCTRVHETQPNHMNTHTHTHTHTQVSHVVLKDTLKALGALLATE